MGSIDLKKLDKSDWKTYRFDQIAKKVSETVDPNTTDLDIYIGLEHIDPESIHIKRKGTPSDVSGGKLKCYPGDVIFGKRRAYQRKAAIVDFEGICSAHAFVLRANPNVIDPKLFPFFLHSDLFMHRMVDISVGGLSPTINWGHLKVQDFLLPPKDQQAKLAKLLCAMDDLLQCKINLLETVTSFFQTMRKDKVLGLKNSEHLKRKGDTPLHWNHSKLKELFERITEKNRNLESNNVLTVSSLYGLINQQVYFNKSVASKNLSPYYLLQKGDFAYNKSSSLGFPAGAIKRLNRYENGVVSPLYICFRSKESAFEKYFEYLFDSGFLNNQILRVAKEGARSHGLLNITTTDFFNLIVPLPSTQERAQIVHELEFLEERVMLVDELLKKSQTLLKSLINQVF